ncbi:MAG: hypothetical protein AAFV72_12155 [Cyanobacteria bacterium J06635_1]
MAAINSSDANIQRLKQLRPMLLKLHKALLDSERIVYEREHGPIKNSGEFFRLVISHTAFDWLRPISQFIVQIDEFLDPKEPPENPSEGAAILLEKARLMMKPAEESSTPLGSNYFRAIQRDPNIALMHAEVSEVLRGKGRG